jgi:hypothetical protein
MYLSCQLLLTFLEPPDKRQLSAQHRQTRQWKSNTSTATVVDVEMTDQVTLKGPPALFKTYFDDPTMSDITIMLQGRTVYAHGIVLCRGSEYFSNLLAESSHVRISTLAALTQY